MQGDKDASASRQSVVVDAPNRIHVPGVPCESHAARLDGLRLPDAGRIPCACADALRDGWETVFCGKRGASFHVGIPPLSVWVNVVVTPVSSVSELA